MRRQPAATWLLRTVTSGPACATDRRDASATTTISSLFERLDAGRTFDQAQGTLMARSGMSAAEAFEALLLAATQQGVSLPETAGGVQAGPWADANRTPLPITSGRGSAP